MKKLQYIAAFLLLLTGCNHEFIEHPQIDPDKGKVTLEFTVDVPRMGSLTKAMADRPEGQFKSLHIAVFDKSGYLSEYIKASPDKPIDNGIRYNYTAKISESKEERILHFIGNGPESVRFGTEEAVMASIKSTGNDDLYWYRRELPSVEGVAPGMSLLAEDDPESGQQIDAATRIHLSNVPLVRNFVKIVLEDDAPEFELERYAVVNSLNDGMLAAYNTKTGQFVEYFNYVPSTDPVAAANGVMEVGTPKTYETLTSGDDKYDGNIPAVTSFVSPTVAWANAVGSGEPYFIYERETPVDNPTYIIAYGEYQGKNYYYKIDLRSNSGAYFPLLRNFEYKLTLTAVGRMGYETIEEAANSAGSGDVSTSIETISLVYISDGTASLKVDYTEKVVTSADPVTLGFTFLTDVNNTNSYGAVSNIQVRVNDDYGLTGPAIKSAVWDNKNSGVITITPTTPEGAPKSQSITILAEYEYPDKNNNSIVVTKTLQRTVRYVVMTERTMQLTCTPNDVPQARGSEFELQIKIPGGLSAGMFPLQFHIEAQKLSITPNTNKDNIPVETGQSLVGISSAFYFIKTLEWKDYDPLQSENIISCYFKTNTEIADTDIYVANRYFQTASTKLTTYPPDKFENLRYSTNQIACGEETEFTFMFNLPKLPENKLQEIGAKDGNVVVILDSAEPDPNYSDELQYIDVYNGKARYVYKAENVGNQTLHLMSNTHGGLVTVTLMADHYLPASLSCERNWIQFTGLNFRVNNQNAENVRTGVGVGVTFRFSYNNSVPGVPVTMTLTGLKPANVADNELTYNADGTITWTYRPTNNNQQQNVNLVTTSFGRSVSVTLNAENNGYEKISLTAARALVLPQGTILSADGINANNIDYNNITYHRQDPGTTATPTGSAQSMGNVRAENGAIEANYTLSTGEYSETSKIWFRFYTGNTNRVYYTAQLTALQISNGENMVFTRRN